MSDDSWKNSYDAWKTRDPGQDGPVCPKCGGWLYRNSQFVLECEDCAAVEHGPDPDAAYEELFDQC